MKNIKYEFFGNSHGQGYFGKIFGLPKNFVIDIDQINFELNRRKTGYGRSSRQTELQDKVEFLNFDGKTSGNALEFFVKNAKTEHRENFSALRSGHVDLVGSAKHNTMDIRSLNEKASGRNSLCYVVLGAICKQILKNFGIFTYSYTKQISNVLCPLGFNSQQLEKHLQSQKDSLTVSLNCPDEVSAKKMQAEIDQARQNGDSLGGIVAVFASGVKLGQLGDFFPYETRLDGIIAGHMLSIPAVKGIEFGIGKQYAESTGSQTVDKLAVNDGEICYSTNNSGGIVAGISNGAEISFELTVKPVPTIKNTQSIDLVSKLATLAHFERADTCIVPTIGVIAENILATVLLDQLENDRI